MVTTLRSAWRNVSAVGLFRLSGLLSLLRFRTLSERLLARAERLAPERLDIIYAHARSLMALERFAESLEVLDRLIGIWPQWGAWQYERGWLLQKLGRDEEAVAAFDLALSADPPEWRAHLDRGLSLESLGRTREAHQAYERGLRHEPLDLFANAYAARSAAWSGDWSLAAQRCQRAYDLDPTTDSALDLAMARIRLRDWAEAERTLRAALRRDSGSCDLRIQLCELLLLTDRFDEAEKVARAVVQDYPETEAAFAALCAALVQNGQQKEAEEIAEQLVQLRPAMAMAHGNRGWIALRCGKPQKALECFELAMSLDPDDVAAVAYRAAALSALHLHEEAAAAFDELTIVHPEIFTDDPELAGYYEAAKKASTIERPGSQDRRS